MAALTNDLIQPVGPLADTAFPAPALAPTSPTPSKESKKGPILPPEVQGNKVVKDILQGAVPGVLVRPGIYYPKAWKIAENFEDLMAVGLDFYFAKDASTVLFNPIKISEEELQTADSQGTLTQIVPDYETLSGERPQTPPKDVQQDLLALQAMSLGPSPTPAAPGSSGGLSDPGMMPPAPPPPASSDRKLMTQRLRNVNVAAAGPTSGPVPGAGRVLNAASIPVV